MVTINFDTNKSVEQLESSYWKDELKYQTGLIEKCHLYRKKPIGKLAIEEIRLLIGQNIALHYLIPVALNILKDNPFTGGDFYPGDLLNNVLKSEVKYWKACPEQRSFLLQILQESEDRLIELRNKRLNETIKKFKINL